MQKICAQCKDNFEITEGELAMYKKVDIVVSNLCFKCRVANQFAFWAFGKFRIGKSDFSGEEIITTYEENSRFPIYTNKEWHSDVWDEISYGISYDETRPFFDQLKELQEKIPRPHMMGTNNENCDWSYDAWNSKNCYLSRSVDNSEDLIYGYRTLNCKNCTDIVFGYDLENCYDCTFCFKSYNLKYSINSKDCFDSYFLYDCRNSSNCFMCWNLRGKSYCIENVQYSKEEYNEKLKSFNLTSRKSIEDFKSEFYKYISQNVIHRQNFNIQTTNCTGNFLSNMNNSYNCFSYSDSVDIYNAVRGLKSTSTIDANGCWYAEMIGNCFGCVEAYELKYCCWSSARYSEYLDICEDSEYCFGCVGLRKKKYCILNKQYTKEEYEILKNKIISDMTSRGEYGKFLPYNMSLSSYNLSTGMFYVPKTKEEIIALGGYWNDVELTQTNGEDVSNIPDLLSDVTDDICSVAFICPKSGYRFNISTDELAFYRKWGIPLPDRNFDVRTKQKLEILTSIELNNSTCYFCKKDILISYKKEWNYKKVACEDCYKREVL